MRYALTGEKKREDEAELHALAFPNGVWERVEKVQENNMYTVRWNAGTLSSGLYLCRLEAASVSKPNDSFVGVKKMQLMR